MKQAELYDYIGNIYELWLYYRSNFGIIIIFNALMVKDAIIWSKNTAKKCNIVK